MRILFVSESLWMEGVVYDLHIVAEGLSLLGHKVFAIDPGCYCDEPSPTRVVHRVFPEARVELRSPHSPALSLGNLSLDTIPAARRLYAAYRRYLEIGRYLDDEKIDIIVLYSAARSGIQTVRLAKKRKIPVVFRNVDILYNLWPTPFLRTIIKQIEKYIYRRMDMLLALTPKYAEYLIKFGADRSKVDLLLSPIDIQQFHPFVDCSEVCRRWGIDDDDQVIVFIGTLYEFGGLIEFTRELPSILKEVSRVKFLIVGDGPIRPALQKVIAELKLEERVIITGYQPYSDMPKYVTAATVCLNVFPINKRTEDIFSNKIIQYLSCGKSTVSTALPGITTLLDSESCGVVYSDTIEGLARELVDLLKSPARRKHLEQVGRIYVERAHSHTKVSVRFEEALRKVLKIRSAGTRDRPRIIRARKV